jgi:hypothetical protein
MNMASSAEKKDLSSRIDHLERLIAEAEASFDRRVGEALARRMFVPNLATSAFVEYGEFMRFSTCSSADFLHPMYAEICRSIRVPTLFNRKMWEWAYIIHKLKTVGALAEGRRGVAFGVGKERLPALFASMGASVVATDAPEEIGEATGWSQGAQYSNSLEQLRCPEIVADEVFDAKVTHRSCDMNAIDNDLTGFDFTWSSCCFEHLGSLEAGIQFVINSVEKTLKVGGVACHTTEFNLSSDEDTVTDGATVIYRRRDMMSLIGRLRERGHEVEPFAIAPDSHFLDYYVDVPPYGSNPHFKLLLGGYVTTSVGIFVRKR